MRCLEHWHICLPPIPARHKSKQRAKVSDKQFISMTLNIYYSLRNKVFKLVNIDGFDLTNSLNRNIDSWSHVKAENISITYWKNTQQSVINPFKYNRVGIHYSLNNKRYRKYYFCINEIISLPKLEITHNL